MHPLIIKTPDPSVNGSFAPAFPGELLLHSQYDQSLKVLISHNVDEGLYFTSPFVFTKDTFRENVILVSFPTLQSMAEKTT
jgi:hypothetical protein